jgi:hypothetical protein
MPTRSTTTVAVLGIAFLWAAAVVLAAGQDSGRWTELVLQAVGLLAAAGLVGLFAAFVDDLVDDIRLGGGGGSGGSPRPGKPARVRVERPKRSRPRD